MQLALPTANLSCEEMLLTILIHHFLDPYFFMHAKSKCPSELRSGLYSLGPFFADFVKGRLLYTCIFGNGS